VNNDPDTMPADAVAAIIPLYNGARWIGGCLDSVFAQTHPPAEIIVVDDGSTDDGGKIVEALARQDSRLLLLRKPNGGQSAARNFGAKAARSGRFAFLDQDDLWLPRHVELLMEPFRNNPSLGWSFSDADAMDDNGTIIQRQLLHVRSLNHRRTSLTECVSRDMCILPSASLISRDAYTAVGGFDERLIGYEDDDLFLRLLAAGYDNAFVDMPLLKWRFHDRRTSYTTRMVASRLIYLEKLLANFPELSPAYATRFAMSFLGELARHPSAEKRPIAFAGAELAIPHTPAAKRIVFQAALRSLRAAPTLTAAFLRVAKPARRLLQKPAPKVGDGR
jgi:glycosyltransferase involved in cell wall biosynthesis